MTLSSASPLRYLLVEETIPDAEPHGKKTISLCRVRYTETRTRPAGHHPGIVELVVLRELICMSSDLVVWYMERHSVEELSETRQAEVSWQCRFTTGDSSQSSATRGWTFGWVKELVKFVADRLILVLLLLSFLMHVLTQVRWVNADSCWSGHSSSRFQLHALFFLEE